MSKTNKARKPFTKISDEVRARVLNHLKTTGCTFAAAKVKFGLSAHTISKMVKDGGLKRPAPKPAPKGAAAKAVAAVKASSKAKKPVKDDVL